MSSRIFDIGMNNGDDTAYYLEKGFQVVAVEANPQLADQARARFREAIDDGKLVILNVGIAKEEGNLPFWICDTHDAWSSFDQSRASRENSTHHEISVPCRRFHSIVEEFGTPYYLKVDIEGHEHLCLEAFKSHSLPKYISVEASGVGLLDSLAELGYKQFKCLSQFHYLPLEIPPTSQQRDCELALALQNSRNIYVRIFKRLGGRIWISRLWNQNLRDANWVFPHGSTGPFGEGLPGEWQSYDAMRETFQIYQQMANSGYKTGCYSPFWNDSECSFWADFHATGADS
jgi:FkbM family methyltransferase